MWPTSTIRDPAPHALASVAIEPYRAFVPHLLLVGLAMRESAEILRALLDRRDCEPGSMCAATWPASRVPSEFGCKTSAHACRVDSECKPSPTCTGARNPICRPDGTRFRCSYGDCPSSDAASSTVNRKTWTGARVAPLTS